VLVLEFIVAFDYLPEFRENIVLELVEKPAKLKTVSNTSFRVEIEELEKALESIEQCKLISHRELASHSLTNESEMFSKELNPAKYMLQVSGIFTNPSGGSSTDRVTFEIRLPGEEKFDKSCVVYTNGGYSYPFAFSEVLEVPK
jgi:hypothetical protein